MKKLLFIFFGAIFVSVISYKVVIARNQDQTSFGLKVSPTVLESSVKKGQDKKGFIDISNPDNISKTVTTSVSAFKQTDNNGDLQFYDNPDLNKAILLDLSNFTLGPHEAIRMYYLIKPQNLPAGGTYATIFFDAQPIIETNNPKNISISTKVGTLLVLANGGGQKEANLAVQHIPFWQFGSGLKGNIEVKNIGETDKAVAFHPSVSGRITPWGKTTKFNTPLAFPGITRSVAVDKSGNYLGVLPYTFIVQGKKHIIWLVAVTGYWRVVLPCIIILLVIGVLTWYIRRYKK